MEGKTGVGIIKQRRHLDIVLNRMPNVNEYFKTRSKKWVMVSNIKILEYILGHNKLRHLWTPQLQEQILICSSATYMAKFFLILDKGFRFIKNKSYESLLVKLLPVFSIYTKDDFEHSIQKYTKPLLESILDNVYNKTSGFLQQLIISYLDIPETYVEYLSIRVCANCDKVCHKKCCENVYYCNKICQKTHYPKHVKECLRYDENFFCKYCRKFHKGYTSVYFCD